MAAGVDYTSALRVSSFSQLAAAVKFNKHQAAELAAAYHVQKNSRQSESICGRRTHEDVYYFSQTQNFAAGPRLIIGLP